MKNDQLPEEVITYLADHVAMLSMRLALPMAHRDVVMNALVAAYVKGYVDALEYALSTVAVEAMAARLEKASRALDDEEDEYHGA